MADDCWERKRFLQEQTEIAQGAVSEAVRQRELTTRQARAQLQYIANKDAVARQMHSQHFVNGRIVTLQKSDNYKDTGKMFQRRSYYRREMQM